MRHKLKPYSHKVEYLQNQVINIEKENSEVLQLLNNLLTSYYVFIGGIENLIDKPIISVKPAVELTKEKEDTPQEIIINKSEPEFFEDNMTFEDEVAKQEELDFEPFEYFVDFEEPTGEPISDEDLYENK